MSMSAQTAEQSTSRATVKLLAPFFAASAAWVFFSDVTTSRIREPRHALAYSVCTDLAFLIALFYLVWRVLSRTLVHRTRILRAYEMLSRADEVIRGTEDRAKMLEEVCRLAASLGGYRLVWVGRGLHDEAKTISFAAAAGETGYLRNIKVTWSDEPSGRGPVGIAVRTGKASICRNIANDQTMAPWRNQALAHGFRSTGAFPLRPGHERAGAITFYSDRTDAFDADECALLQRLADAVTFALDRLDWKQSQEKSLAALKTLAHAVDHSPASIVVTDAQGNIEFVNRRFQLASGFSADEALGRKPSIQKSGETSPEEYRRMWQAISSGRDWSGVLHNKRKDGTLYWESVLISPVLGPDGKIERYIAVKEDIDEKRSLEQQLRQAQKMESLGALAGGIAHDFNNLLTVIGGHCELLKTDATLSETARESLGEISATVVRASEMTRRLLQFGRKQPMRLQRADLAALVWGSVRMIQRLVGDNYAVEFVRPDKPLHAEVDAGMIEQVLLNLAVNARDAMPAGGRIAVAVTAAPGARPPLGVGPAPAPAGYARLSVADSGSGIAAEHLPHIFEPFFTTKEVGKGTGLGLSVVDGIVRQHGGWIEVDSAAGRGTVFDAYLPLSAGAAAPAPEPPRTPARTAAKGPGACTVLLVEDDPAVRAVAARALESHGCAVTQAVSAEAALEAWRARTGPFRLLITDMVMPGRLTGVDLARRLRAEDASLRVLVVSGYHPDIPLGAREVGDGFPFLAKPFTPTQLLEAAAAEAGA